MRKILLSLLVIIMVVPIVFVATGCRNAPNPFTDATQANLVERYNLTFTAYIWNDYQPFVAYPPRSTHFVGINSSQDFDLSRVQMSVQIVTSRVNITRTFTLRTYGGGSLGGDFRSTEIFRLNDDERFTLYVSILVGGYTQTIVLTGRVFITH